MLAPYRITINLLNAERFKKTIFQRICECAEKVAFISSYLITAATAGFFLGMAISTAPFPVSAFVALVLFSSRFT
jgi:hypothetical protein